MTARETLDLTRSLAQVEFAAAAADRVAVDDAIALLDELLDVAAVLVASEQLGVAEKSVADAVAYAATREQFGRPIGSFQALKHILADMATQADLARSLVEHAVWAAVESPEQLRAAESLIESSRAACAVTAENVQVHGGIGFSWEHPAHLYFRKARSNEMLLGEASTWTERSFAPDRRAGEVGMTAGELDRRTVVVVGAGLAGGRTCAALRQFGHAGRLY